MVAWCFQPKFDIDTMIPNDQNADLNVGELTKITTTFNHEKSRKHYENHYFFFDELPLDWGKNLFSEMDRPHPNCGKTVCFSYVMVSMLPEISYHYV